MENRKIKRKGEEFKKGAANLSSVTDGERLLEPSIGFGGKGDSHTFENHFRRVSGKEAESRL